MLKQWMAGFCLVLGLWVGVAQAQSSKLADFTSDKDGFHIGIPLDFKQNPGGPFPTWGARRSNVACGISVKFQPIAADQAQQVYDMNLRSRQASKDVVNVHPVKIKGVAGAMGFRCDDKDPGLRPGAYYRSYLVVVGNDRVYSVEVGIPNSDHVKADGTNDAVLDSFSLVPVK